MLAMLLGVPAILFVVNPWLVSLDAATLVIKESIWIIPIIIGITIILSKDTTRLIIGIDMKGESYQYKGNKQTMQVDIEKRERLDIVSDIRLILNGHLSKDSYLTDGYLEELKIDLQFVNEKLQGIVPEYRVPS